MPLATPLSRLADGGAIPWSSPGQDPWSSRLWYDAVLAGIPCAPSEPVLATDGAGIVAWPLLAHPNHGLTALATPYTIEWRPLVAPGVDAATLEAAAHRMGRALLRGRPPCRLDALAPDLPGLEPQLAGLRRAGLRVLPFEHFGNWQERLPAGTDWPAYAARRPPALRNTIRRRLARHSAQSRFERITAPGPELDQGIAAYEAVRAGSWKPHEPAPAFDATLMRATAAAGLLRLGVLRDGASGQALAAQYWIVAGGQATVLKLAHREDARATSPGTALTAWMIQGLLAEGGIHTLDFGRGDDAYKPLWASHRRQFSGLLILDQRHPAGLAAWARHGVGNAWRRLRGGAAA